MDDQQSFNLIRQGGKMRDQGVAALYRKHAAHFRKFYLYQGLNVADAEDVVHDTFEKIAKKCDTYNGDSPLEAWLWRIARNCMTDHFRRTKVRHTVNLDEEGWGALEHKPEDFGADPDDVFKLDLPPFGESLEECTNRCFAEFAKKYSECAHVFSLIKDGLDTASIANIKQCKPGTMRERISKCYKRARVYLLPYQELRAATYSQRAN